ncbi:hypothetical protein ACLOJK_034549 [Asimina triloba]
MGCSCFFILSVAIDLREFLQSLQDLTNVIGVRWGHQPSRSKAKNNIRLRQRWGLGVKSRGQHIEATNKDTDELDADQILVVDQILVTRTSCKRILFKKSNPSERPYTREEQGLQKVAFEAVGTRGDKVEQLLVEAVGLKENTMG